MKMELVNDLGVRKEVKIGFSWTTLFFGAIPCLFRGDFVWFLIQALASMLTYGLSHLIFAFIYNRIYISGLLEKGYRPNTEEGARILSSEGFII